MLNQRKGTPVRIKAICINDSNKPSDIPNSKWVIKDNKYTIIEFLYMQGGVLGVKLAEINLDDCFPYQAYRADRFNVLKEDDIDYQQEGESSPQELKTAYKNPNLVI